MYSNQLIECPVCKNKTFDYISYKDEIWGGFYTVEQHGYCSSCGYVIEMAYSNPLSCFCDITKGIKLHNGKYLEKDIRKHKRNRRKSKYKERFKEHIPINPYWSRYI